MSRSIGDEVSQTVGVISVPEIIPHQIQSNDIFAIWASDGVFEFLSNEQAVSIIWKYKHDLQEAVNQLVEEAAKMWRKEEEVGNADAAVSRACVHRACADRWRRAKLDTRLTISACLCFLTRPLLPGRR
jgi:serine/threonine protein phosphatase PrpC